MVGRKEERSRNKEKKIVVWVIGDSHRGCTEATRKHPRTILDLTPVPALRKKELRKFPSVIRAELILVIPNKQSTIVTKADASKRSAILDILDIQSSKSNGYFGIVDHPNSE